MKRILLASIATILAISLNAQETGTFTDARDSLTYKTVEIGSQVWMAENLAYKPSKGNYWAYNNKQSNAKKYGYLYNWHTAQNVCPTGWHLPSDEEWALLTEFAGKNEGAKLKANSGWSNNGNGTDDYGFSAIPGSFRRNGGLFGSINDFGGWWTTTASNASNAYIRYMKSNSNNVSKRYHVKRWGFSVRCLKD